MKTSRENTTPENPVFQQAYARRRTAAADHWLEPVRERAIDAFARTGFPTVRDEDWKYTNLTEVAARSAEYLQGQTPAVDEVAIRSILDAMPIEQGAQRVVFANGVYREDLSDPPTDPGSVRIETLSGVAEDSKARILEQIGRYAEIEKFQLAALNAAFMHDGLVIQVPDGTEHAKPIHTIFVSDRQKTISQPRILIGLGQHSDATVIEHHAGGGPGLTNAVTEIHCGEGAHLRYIKVQQEHDTAYHLAAQYVRQDRGSRFDAVHLDFGGKLSRNDLTVGLAGSEASAELYGLFVVDGERHADNHTRIDHFEGHTTSVESYRGIMNERGRGVFNGKIVVHPGADKTDARLENRNLLLSANTEIDTKPELEIYTDDVKCAHGTTTGQLDENQMFYLRTRGIPEDLARRMLVAAFGNQIIDQMDRHTPVLAEHVRNTLAKSLPG